MKAMGFDVEAGAEQMGAQLGASGNGAESVEDDLSPEP